MYCTIVFVSTFSCCSHKVLKGEHSIHSYKCVANILLDVEMRQIYYTIPMHVQVTLYLTILGLVRMLVYYMRDSYRNERSFGWSYFKLYGLFMSGRIMTYFFFASVLQTLPFAIIWFFIFIIYESICIVYGCVGLQDILKKRYKLAKEDCQEAELNEWMWKYIKFSIFSPVLNFCLTLLSITELLFVFGFFFAMLVNTELDSGCIWFRGKIQHNDSSEQKETHWSTRSCTTIVGDFSYIATILLRNSLHYLYHPVHSTFCYVWKKKRLYGDNSWLAEMSCLTHHSRNDDPKNYSKLFGSLKDLHKEIGIVNKNSFK